MSALRRSSSPLSSASPSPLQAPTGADEAAPLTALNLGASIAARSHDNDGNIVGGSSPTTLTEPLTESELTEDEDDMEDRKVDPADEPVDNDALDALSDIGDEDGDDEAEVDTTGVRDSKRSLEGSPLSPSPSLTPPPPSDPPHPQALPSSPHAADDSNGDITIVQQDDDDVVLADDEAVESRQGVNNDADVAEPDSGDDDLTPDDEDGDVTMQAEADPADDDAAEPEDATDINDSPVKQDTVDDDIELDEEEPNPDVEIRIDVAAAEEAEEDEEGEEEAEETDTQEAGTAVQSRSGHSAHAPLPTASAMRALFALEVKFAALRDRLYVERLEEAAREEEMILNGTHPALLQLNKTLQSRRERLHEIASRRHHEAINDLGTWREVEEKISWQTWTDQRDQLHWEEFEHTWSKRRRLAREKNELETPKVHRPVPRVDRPPKPFDWSAGAVPPKLSTEDALRDLRMMDTRRQQQQQQQQAQQQQQQQQQQQHASRHASPMYGSSFGGPSSSMYPYQAAQHPANYLQGDNSSHPADRRHEQRPQQPHRAPAASQSHASSHAHPPEQPSRMAASSAAGPSRPHAPPRKVEAYVPPRRDLSAQSNGERINGHAPRAAPRPLAAAGASSGASINHPPAAAESKPSAPAPTAQPAQQDRPSSRFPGFTEYLSGTAAHPPNSFQHHLNPPAAKPAASSTVSTSASAPGSTLVRPAFSQAAQVQTASAQRS